MAGLGPSCWWVRVRAWCVGMPRQRADERTSGRAGGGLAASRDINHSLNQAQELPEAGNSTYSRVDGVLAARPPLLALPRPTKMQPRPFHRVMADP